MQEVLEFLASVGLERYAESFKDAEITGDVLLEAGDEMLGELGVASTLDRLKITMLFKRTLQGAVERCVGD